MPSHTLSIILFFSITALLDGQSLSFLPPQPAGGGGLRYPVLPNSLAAGDFNKDGKLDLVTVGGSTGLGQRPVTVSFGNGDGTFHGLTVLDANDVASSPVVADFNGDGNLDLAYLGASASSPAPYPGGILILFGKGDGTFSAPSVTPLSGQNINVLITTDLNLDGKPDLIAGQTILIGKGDGTFTAQAASLDTTAVLTADFNKDGKPDLLLVVSSGQLAVVLGAGDGTFGKDIPVASSTVPGSYVAGDLNNDGKIDLAISPAKPLSCITNCANPTAMVFFLRGNGDGTFQPPSIAGQSMGPILAVADMNRDGNLDLIVGNSVLPGIGDGTFGFPVFYGLTQQPCTVSRFTGCQVSSDFAAIVADFNGDGLNDIAEALDRDDVVGDFSDADVNVLLNDSPGDGFLVTGVSSASYRWPAGATSMVTAFGTGLATSTQSAADAGAPPTTLGGIRVHLQDRIGSLSDHLAPLFYVSPTQINFEVSTTDSFVYISIEKVGLPYVAKGLIIPLQPIQPDLYTVNSSSLAAASAVSISANGVQTTLATVSCTSSCSAVPINVATAPVYLSLYGTGFDSALNQTNSTCTVGKATVNPSYAGPQGQILGFDQINLPLPATLAGSGTIPIQCTFGGMSTNQVLIAIQ